MTEGMSSRTAGILQRARAARGEGLEIAARHDALMSQTGAMDSLGAGIDTALDDHDEDLATTFAPDDGAPDELLDAAEAEDNAILGEIEGMPEDGE
jgi:hypothetical protein